MLVIVYKEEEPLVVSLFLRTHKLIRDVPRTEKDLFAIFCLQNFTMQYIVIYTRIGYLMVYNVRRQQKLFVASLS